MSADVPMHFPHTFTFDPAYGYSLSQLLAIPKPTPPQDFQAFWQQRYQQTLKVQPIPNLSPSQWQHADYDVYDIHYLSTQAVVIQGWLMQPKQQPITRGLVVGHGYGGRDAPDFSWGFAETAVLFPCFRGLSRSTLPGVSSNPSEHVLHNINNRDEYIIGGCVDDIWLGVATLLELFPTINTIGYAGTSFGGGVGTLAFPWDQRINKAYVNVPTFGHQALRLTLPTVGSGEAVRQLHAQGVDVMQTLAYYDAASAAQFNTQPVLVAAALFDPAVAPPGQFAIYNAFNPPKELFVLEAGHYGYPNQPVQEKLLNQRVKAFFSS
jgi:cephalosporin-C deacetylase